MADDLIVDGAALADFTIATDELPGPKHAQKIKLMDGTDNSTAMIPGDASNGLDVDVTRLPALATGDNTVGRIKVTDGTTVASVADLTNSNPQHVLVVDGNGSPITTFSGSGGTSALDDADFVAGTTAGTPIQGVYEPSPTSVTADDMGIIGIDQNRRVRVSVDASTLDVAHDAVDSGNPVGVGFNARTSFPTAVANADRVRGTADTLGRQQVTHISGEQFIWKQVEATSTQTGTTIWDPTAGKRIAVTGYEIGTGGTTSALVTIWFGANADTTFTQGTDQVLFRGTLIPSATSAPGVISNFASPVFCTTADHELHYTTSAGITIYITIMGYEW